METPEGQSISLRHRRSIAYWLNNAAHPECVITKLPQIIFNEVSNGVGGVEPDENSYFYSVTWLDRQFRNDPYNSLYTVLCLYQAGGSEPISQSMYNRLAEYVSSQEEIVINPLPVEEEREFDHWEENGVSLGTDNPLSFVITSNRNIKAVTRPKQSPPISYTCTTSTDGFGSVTGGGTYKPNAVVELEWRA